MLRQNGEAVNQGPDHGADSSCLDTWCCAGVDRELGKDREGLVRAHLELARLALSDLRPEHYGEMPWMCFCELQIRDARFDEAIFGRRGAFVFLPKRRGEEAESLGRDLSQDCLLVGEVAVRRVVADAGEPGDLTERDFAGVAPLGDVRDDCVEERPSKVAVVIGPRAGEWLHEQMLTRVYIAGKICRQPSTSQEVHMSTAALTQSISTGLGPLHVEDRGTGPAVLAWPSLYCDARTLDRVVEDLANDHRVVVIDGPGHGGSAPRTSAFTFDDCANAAVEVLDTLKIPRAIWFGAAWGGGVGLAAALQHPQRLLGLAMVNAPLRPWRAGGYALMRLTYALLWMFGPRSFVAGLIADKTVAPNAGPDRGAIVAAAVAALNRCDRRGLLVAAHSVMFNRPDFLPLLPKVSVPTLLMTGAEDSLFPPAEARTLADAIPNCRFVVLERSAHQSPLEVPGDVSAAIRDRYK